MEQSVEKTVATPLRQPGTEGWLSSVPSSWVPYLELMRLDRPNGYWYFWWPHFHGTLLAAISQRSRIHHLLIINIILALGVLIMRGATCTWNDSVDVEFDRKISRTKNRPIARGAVSTTQANLFTTVQTIWSLATLSLLPPESFLYAVPGIIGWVGYPLAKRVTHYPQLVLGFPMGWGVFMGAAAMGADPLHLSTLLPAFAYPLDLTTIKNAGQALWASEWDLSIIAFYGAHICWTLFYETIYSHQDASEDVHAGVKNIVVLYKGHTRPLLARLAVVQVALLALAGLLRSSCLSYYLFTVGITAVTLGNILVRVKLTDPASCAWWFKVGCSVSTGGAMSLGLLGEYFLL
jgi:4-hydroxybenzoate polyprenyltransferase